MKDVTRTNRMYTMSNGRPIFLHSGSQYVEILVIVETVTVNQTKTDKKKIN